MKYDKQGDDLQRLARRSDDTGSFIIIYPFLLQVQDILLMPCARKRKGTFRIRLL